MLQDAAEAAIRRARAGIAADARGRVHIRHARPAISPFFDGFISLIGGARRWLIEGIADDARADFALIYSRASLI